MLWMSLAFRIMLLTKMAALLHSSSVHLGSLHDQNIHHQFKPWSHRCTQIPWLMFESVSIVLWETDNYLLLFFLSLHTKFPWELVSMSIFSWEKIPKRCLLQPHIASRTHGLRYMRRRSNTWGRNRDQIPRVHVWGQEFVPPAVMILVCIISKSPGCWSSNLSQPLGSQIALDYYAFPW